VKLLRNPTPQSQAEKVSARSPLRIAQARWPRLGRLMDLAARNRPPARPGIVHRIHNYVTNADLSNLAQTAMDVGVNVGTGGMAAMA
jgi:hypothetical protein